MAIFHPPIQATFVGGAQPYGAEAPFTPSGVPPSDNPPFSNEDVAQTTLTILDAWKAPDPLPFMGRFQALDPSRLNPDILNVPITTPPFTHPGRTVMLAEIIALNQPEVWPYTFIGNSQPYQPFLTFPSRLDIPINNPPFTMLGRTAQIAAAVEAALPDIYGVGLGQGAWPASFMGGRQAYENLKLNAALLNVQVDAPTPTFGSEIDAIAVALDAWKVPDPFPFMGGRQPLGERRLPPSIIAVPQNNPPFTRRVLEIATQLRQSWEPPPPDAFMGRWQPLEKNKLPPSILFVPVNEPPYSSTWVQTISQIIDANQPPPPNAFMGGRQPLHPAKLPPVLMAVRVDKPPQHRTFNWYSINQQWETAPLFAPDFRGSSKVTSVVPQMSLQLTYIIVIVG